MATSKNGLASRGSHNGSVGLLANGSAGPWEIAIDETTVGKERWFAQVEGPLVSLYFEITSVAVVGNVIKFLGSRSRSKRNGVLEVSKDRTTPVTLVKDDEYPDRFFLLVGPMDNPVVRHVIAGTNVIQITEALRQVQEDLDAND